MARIFQARLGQRGTNRYAYAELHLMPGPPAVGVTGDNSYLTLYGQRWALVLTRQRVLQLHRWSPELGWVQATTNLPTVIFGPQLPATARRFTACFDQSARIIVAYEDQGIIRVTRWEGSSYIQNVTFAGHDPQLIIDAQLADPRGFPTEERNAYLAGIRVLFQWLPNGQWLESAIPDSDVLLFYLDSSKVEVRCRVQRQLYDQVHVIHTYAEPVVMDKVIGVYARYQLLLADAAGFKLDETLLSEPYFTDLMISPVARDSMTALVTGENIRVENDTYQTSGLVGLDGFLGPDDIAVVGDTYAHPLIQNELDGLMSPDSVEVVSNVYQTGEQDDLEGEFAVDDILVETTIVAHAQASGLLGEVIPDGIRVQTV